MGKTLFIDTSGEELKTSIVSSGKIVNSISQKSELNHTDSLLKQSDQLLLKSGVKLADLEAIAVHPGPGGYTGLRVGVTTANFLAASRNIPIYSAIDPAKIVMGKNNGFESPVLPIYSNPPVITERKH